MTTPSKIERAEGGVPEWAVKRACELTNLDGSTYSPETIERQGVLCTSIGLAFARYIADHEEEPVEPLLIEAREICAADYRIRYPNVGDGTWPDHCINGAYDSDAEVQLTLAGLRRGIELAGEAK